MPEMSINNFTNQIFNSTWEETLPKIPDNSVDIVITSPPYNVNLGNNKLKKDKYDTYDDDMPYGDYLDWMDKLYTECYRLLKSGGRICINIGDGANGSVPTHADFMIRMRDKAGFIPMTTIIWDKKQIGCSTAWGSYQSPSCPSFPTQFEFIVVMAKDTTHHAGDKEKITVGGKEFQRNSRALWTFPPETRMMKEYGHPACVDDKTECLTIDGWKSYDKLEVGDLVASLDLETGLMEWQKNLHTTVYNHNGKSVNVQGRHLDMVLSPIHRCVVKKDKKYIIKMAKDLVPHDKIPCSSKWANSIYPEHLAQSLMFPDKHMAYLAGFFIGDGHYKKDKNGKVYTIVIDQSETVNHAKVEKVRKCLNHLGAEFKENRRTKIHSYDKSMKSDFISFNIKGKIRDEIMFLCQYPMKKVPKLSLHWDEKTLMSFVDGIVDADGHRRGNNLIISQKDNSILNDFHAIGVRLGYDSYISSYVEQSSRNGYVEFTNKKHKLLRNSKASLLLSDNYTGTMWCPYVEKNGTLVARRNGRVFITGNCFPEELPRRLLQQLTYEGDIVLDPFSGVGTTCAVAKQLSRRYIGTEMSKKYYETSMVRLGAIPTTVKTENGEEAPEWMV